MTVILANPEATILREIACSESRRRDIAQTYRLAMLAEQHGERVDWVRVNQAIMTRWSRSGLEWIKNQAHSGKCFNPPLSKVNK